jgi:putative ABC transport system permease protein
LKHPERGMEVARCITAMSTLFFDIRSAFRQMVRYRAFSTLVILTLALGIGATTTFFSLLNAFIFRPLPYADPDRLVAVRGLVDTGTVAPSYESVARLQRSPFQAVVACTSRDVNATAPDGAERALSTRVSGDIFNLLGASFSVGRPFLPTDLSATTPTAVISYSLWVRHYGADPTIVGRTIALDRVAHEIVGVAPEGFGFPGDTDIWVPLDFEPGRRPEPIDVIARLADGVTVAQASAMLAGLSAVDPTHSPPSARGGPNVIGLHDAMVSSKHRTMLTALLTATILVLLIACANLAGLLAAHLDSRRHEIAMRVALGARRIRIIRLLLIESVVLATAGGAFGILVAQWGIDLFGAILGKPEGAGWLNFTIDGRVLLFAFGASLITALLFGLGPAMGATGVDLRGVLQDDGRAVGVSRRGRRMRGLLVAAQITVSLGLISAAWSIVSSARAFSANSPGFDTDRLVVLRLNLEGSAYDSAASRTVFVDRAVERLALISGVNGVTATTALPLADRNVPFSQIVFEGAEANAARVSASLRYVLGSYPRIAGVPIRLGRSFSDSEAADPRTPLVLVNDTMARRYWPGVNPIGKRLRLADSPNPDTWLTVTGVVGGVSQRNPGDDPGNQIYLPLAAARDRDISFVVRAVHNDRVVIAPARQALSALDKDLPIVARTMRDVYAWFERDREGQGLVLAALGTVALLLAALGVYAIMSLLVSQQSQEFAIRLALGCSAEAVERLVLARGLRVASIGVVGGLILGGLVTVFLSHIFYGVRAFDLSTVLGGAALLTATALVASWWPARRAMRVDPMVMLRR